MQEDFILSVPKDNRRDLAKGWLWLGLISLLVSGIFSVLLVVFRTPYIQNIFSSVDFFRTALVVHVDLSVLVWFLAFGGVFWSLNSTTSFIRLGWSALFFATLGTIVMVLAPFIGNGNPLMSNYIPVLQDSVFITGLLLFAAGITLLVLRSMFAIPLVGLQITGVGSLRFGLNTAAISAIMALLAFFWSFLAMPDFVTGKAFYELLFWGGGHMLQFTYTLLMLVAWLWLATASGLRIALSPRVVLLLFILGLMAVFTVPLIYYSYKIISVEHIKLFTWLMAYGGSLATLPLALAILHGFFISSPASGSQTPLRASLIMSMILFGVGGVIGFMIQGSNVTIPAHYHGSIVGVTLAFMGMTYDLLPRFGYKYPVTKLAHAQPYIYGVGQLLHVSGLVWSGGYGVQRKVAGIEQGLDGIEKITAMGLMGLGGLIAIIGGLMFLLVVYKAMTKERDHKTS